MRLNKEALNVIDNKRRGKTVREHAGRRFKMTGVIASMIESQRELLWELPGVDWTEK